MIVFKVGLIKRVTGLTIIEIWEDGELVASDVVRI